MRILQVVPTYLPAVRYGGPIRSVHGLSAALARRGHEVHVFTTSVDGPCDLDVPVGQVVDLDGVAVRYFTVPALRRLYWSPGMGERLRREMSTFEIAHLHSVYLWPTLAAARCAERAGVPYVVSPRGLLVQDLIERKSRWVKTAWIQLFERRTIRRAALMHATSATELADWKALGLPLNRVACVGNGVEWPAAHLPLAAGPHAQLPPRYALYLGRLNWKKGLDRLIQSWERVADLPLVIAGNDEDGYRDRLERLGAQLGVAQRLHFIGEASDAHKWALYENATCFVLPSYSENFANVVAEAMAMACPVVVTPEVGLSHFVREHQAGIVTSGDAAPLAEAVLRIANDPALRHRLGQNGRSAVQRHLSWTAISAAMESAYTELREDCVA